MDTQDQNLPLDEDAFANSSTKQDYEGEMENRLKKLGKQIDNLIDRADSSTTQVVEKVKAKKDNALYRLKLMKGAGSEAWFELKRGMDCAWEDLQTAWQELKQASENAAQKFHKQT